MITEEKTKVRWDPKVHRFKMVDTPEYTTPFKWGNSRWSGKLIQERRECGGSHRPYTCGYLQEVIIVPGQTTISDTTSAPEIIGLCMQGTAWKALIPVKDPMRCGKLKERKDGKPAAPSD
jgi:hypothetical protein